MIKNGRYVFVFTIAVFLSSAFSLSAENETQKYTLDNGLVVLITPLPSSPVVAVQALVKTGSTTEGKYLGAGISHFIEHMLFKGTVKRPGPSQIPTEVRGLGGYINASTSFDHTTYTIDLPKEKLSQGIDIIADMLMNAKFDPKETEKERQVIRGEMRLYEDNPDRHISDLTFQAVYTHHPYRHPVIGYKPLFDAVSRDDLLDYYHSSYIPNNIIFTIAGDLNVEETLKHVKDVSKDFKPKNYPLRNLPQEPPQITNRRVDENYATPLTRIVMAHQGVSLNDNDLFALDTLGMILGQGSSSRFYENIFKKKNLVYAISAGNFTPMDRGLFEIDATLEDKNVEGALKAVKEEIENLKKNGISADELEKAKRQVVSANVFNRQTASGIAEDVAINEFFMGDLNFSQKYVDAVKNLTQNDIQQAANKYLKENTLSTIVLHAKAEGKKEIKENKPRVKNEIEKVTLDNGMTILFKEDHTLPLTFIRLVLRGGLLEEAPETNGIFNLMAGLWSQGTKSRSAEQIAHDVEAKGMHFGGFSGKNSFGLSCDFLSEDLDFGLSLLEDAVKNPIFPEVELSKEKESVKSAILSRKDDILTTALLELKKELFFTHPYHFDDLGTLESVEKIKREDIAAVYQGFSVPQNMVWAVFGDFDKTKVLAFFKEKFSNLKKTPLTLSSPSLVSLGRTQENDLTMDKEQAVVAVGFQGPALDGADRYGIEVLSSVLGSPLNGRIFIKIREELGKAYTLGGSYIPGIKTGTIYFYVSTTQAQVDKVKELLLEQLQNISKQGITDQELKNTQTYLKGTDKIAREAAGSLASSVALDELYGLGFNAHKDYDKKIDAVTKADVKRLAQKYLDVSKAAVVVIKSPHPQGVKQNPVKEDIYIYNDIGR